MHHKILSENNYELAQFIDDVDTELHNFLADNFIDTDSSNFSYRNFSDKDERGSIKSGGQITSSQ